MNLPNFSDCTFKEVQDGLSRGAFTSVQLVNAYLARIDEVNDKLRAVICTNPKAIEDAAQLDRERQEGSLRGPLHGLVIGVKDNIAVKGLDSMAGSFALKGAVVPGDADAVKNLRKAGAIIIGTLSVASAAVNYDKMAVNLIGKMNLSMWANFRDSEPGAWSPIAGQCVNPYYPEGHPAGSSSGSGVAAAVGLAAGCIGSETRGSIVSPASHCSVVGIRPTVGVVPGNGIIPISILYDSAGPMCRTVEDSVFLLEAMAQTGVPYTKSLDANALAGVRLAIPRNCWSWSEGDLSKYVTPEMQGRFEIALDVMRELGATVIDVEFEEKHIGLFNDLQDTWLNCVRAEFKQDIVDYLATLKHVPTGVKTLQDIIEWSRAHPEETPPTYESLKNFEKAQAGWSVTDDAYKAARKELDASKGVLDYEMNKHGVKAMILPSICLQQWGVAAYPLITVPLGYLPSDTIPNNEKAPARDNFKTRTYFTFPNKPYGITFAGSANSEPYLIGLAYAFEQATRYRDEVKPHAGLMPNTQLKDVIRT